MINETLSNFFFNKHGTQVQILRYALARNASAPGSSPPDCLTLHPYSFMLCIHFVCYV